ncbi:MAG: hypothetical protein ACYS1A_08155 [Planctomycetota bacterium]|jgi:hypothetical protein
MPIYQDITKLIYERMFEILQDSAFDYFETRQKGFYPRAENLVNPTFYPWAFIEFGGISHIEVIRAPMVWEYHFTIALVAMTCADKGDPTSLVFNDGTNDKKGIGDIIEDVGSKYWENKNDFGVTGNTLRDWSIARVGPPSILNVQRLLVHPFIRGVQFDFVFQINERGI